MMFSELKENSWELLRSTWCPTELSTPGNPRCRFSDFSLQTLFVVLFYYCFPDHWVFPCRFTVFVQLWGSIRAGPMLCATSTSLPSHWDTELSSGPALKLPWMWTGNNSSCKPAPGCSWWSRWVYPTGKNHILQRHLVIKHNTWYRFGTSS